MSVLTCNEAASVCKFMAENKPVLLYEGLESLDGPENDKHALHRLHWDVEKKLFESKHKDCDCLSFKN
jgi:hypothetical protein